MRRRIVVLLNAGSGTGHDAALAGKVRALLKSSGDEVEVRLLGAGARIADAVAAAKTSRPDVLVAGGGDGTVSAVAAGLVDSDIVLGVLPLGTLNHFAKDLGIPLEVDAAARTIVEGHTTRIDVGEVNGRIFVNNSSLGLYPEIVRDRERQRRRLGRGKWPALAWATVTALRRKAFLDVTLRTDGGERPRRTPFVFVGNNEYRMEGFAIGERAGGLRDGLLSVYLTQRPGRLRLVALALRALVGRLRQARDFEVLRAADLVIASRHRRLQVATDGEIAELRTPLRYRIRRACLRVAVPPAS